GHGVCGLSQGSGRSLVNVLVFMGVGMLTVAALRQWA
ncbi:MAG: YeeE/YedE family protein, partial [Rubrivivax sp.]|nr:YeeE/YedE family protein [Rubrivivax sp.]